MSNDFSDIGFLWNLFKRTIKLLNDNTIFVWIREFLLKRNSWKKWVIPDNKVRTYADSYVCIMFFLSLLCGIFSQQISNTYLNNIVVIAIVYRLYEMSVAILYNFFTSEQSEKNLSVKDRVASIKRSILLFVMNMIEIANWFIVLYIQKGTLKSLYNIPKYLELFESSFLCFITQDADKINNIFNAIGGLTFAECVLGYLYTVCFLAILIGNAPQIKSLSNK